MLGGVTLPYAAAGAAPRQDSLLNAAGPGPVPANVAAGMPYATVSAGIAAQPYPVEFRLGRDAPPHPFEYIPPREHERIIARTSTYDASTDLQAMLNGWTPAGGRAGTEQFPVGRFALGQELRFPNWIGWQGMGRATQFFLLPDHAGPVAFRFDSDPDKRLTGRNGDGYPESRFENRLMDMDINCNHAARVERVVYAPSWNEKCGLYNVLMRNIPHTALEADEFHGGSTGWALEHCEFMFDATARVGLRVTGRGRGPARTLIINRPQINLRNISIVGGAAPAAGAEDGFVAIENDNVILAFGGVNHVEKAWAGVTLDHAADLVGAGWTGSDDNGRVRNMIVRQPTHAGQIDLGGVFPGSARASRTLLDRKAAMVLTVPIGGRVEVPSLPGTAWADGQFKATGAIGEAALRGCASVVRDGGAGSFRVTHSDPFASGADYHVVAEAHDDTPCRAETRASEQTAADFRIRVYRVEDGAPFDPSEVSFRIFRRPGL